MDWNDFGDNILQIAAVAALVPFVGWGVYGLHRRFRRHEEFPPLVEGLTLLVVLGLVAFEMTQMRDLMREQVLYYVFAELGLFISCVSLYAHMAISLTSRLIVDIVSPGEDAAPDQPRFGPAEILEHDKDYEGALQEYQVLARIYPRHPSVHLRIAENLLRLSRPQEAADWLARALKYLPSEESQLPVVSRMCEVYERNLHDTAQAGLVLETFLRHFPASSHAEAIRHRLERLGAHEDVHLPDSLMLLEDAPLSDMDDSEAGPRGKAPLSISPAPLTIERMEDEAAPSEEDAPASPKPPQNSDTTSKDFLEPL